MSQKSLLIVDDDQTMSDLIADTLETDFSDIDTCKSISTAKDMLLENSYDCIIVDIELEDGNGAEVVKYINDWDPGSNKESVKVIISGLINDAFKEKFKEKKIDIGNKLKVVELNGNVHLGPFKIEFVTLTHSILEPNGLSIETPVGTVLHTGDWKCDPNPLIGETINEKKLEVSLDKETAKNIIHTEYHENGQLKHEVKFENFKIKTKD